MVVDLGEIFEKKNIPIFSANIPKDVQKHIFWGTEIIKKNYVVVLKIWTNKKSGPTILSIHPPHPSIKNRRGLLVPRGGSTCREY